MKDREKFEAGLPLACVETGTKKQICAHNIILTIEKIKIKVIFK